MKYFLDTEFVEAKNYLDLISIGIVAEDGREFYGENLRCDWSKSSPWVIENVMPHLGVCNIPNPVYGLTGVAVQAPHELAKTIRYWIDEDEPEFWGYYSSYDWVALCWMFGTMMDLPKGWPMYCRDLRQALDFVGLHHVKQPDDTPHHALLDARWIAETHKQHVRLGNAI